jgi:DNA (cytosine-5)-methyltransferase 1
LNKKNFTFIDLFAGIGGFRIALETEGGQCIGFSEVNKDAIDTYLTNFEELPSKNFGDITKIDKLPKVDFITAGVPCQSWSIAGKNLGFDDDRGQLWNDTIYLLHKTQPKTFIFENVKGLNDPRNKDALEYILKRIRQSGYYADSYLLNSHDYGVSQNRLRIYIIGFKNNNYFQKFKLPNAVNNKNKLSNILKIKNKADDIFDYKKYDLFGDIIESKKFGLSQTNGFNDFFLFNDLRDGHSTIHSWDIISTTKKQKKICQLLLKNRRKKTYGLLDGNPLSLKHFQNFDSSIIQDDINKLIKLDIFCEEDYIYSIKSKKRKGLSEEELLILENSVAGFINVDTLKANKNFKLKNISISLILENLSKNKMIQCVEKRYDFKNAKISSGLFGINRIFLPRSNIFPTLVASDSNDFIALENISQNQKNYKETFINEIFIPGLYRKLTQRECLLLQGFPPTFVLPDSRSRWMKLIGNSVSVPVINLLTKSIINTGVFD